MKTINKYIIAISSIVLIGSGTAAGVLLASNTLSPSVPKLNLKLTKQAEVLTPEEFVTNVMNDDKIDTTLLENYVSGIPNIKDEEFAEINKQYYTAVTNVSYIKNEDTNFVEITIFFKSKESSFSQSVKYKISGLQFKSEKLFNDLIVSTTPSATIVLPSQVNIRNYRQYIKFSIGESFPTLDTTAKFYVKKITSNDNLGVVELELVYENKSLTKTRTIKIEGFSTTDYVQKQELEMYIDRFQIIKNPITVPKALPSELNDGNYQNYLTLMGGIQLVGLQQRILSFNPNDNDGTLKLTIEFKYHKNIKEQVYNIDGFQTIRLRKEQKFNDFCNNLILSVSAEGAKVPASTVNANNFGVYVNGIPDDHIYAINIVSVVPNDINGSIDVQLKIIGGDNQEFIRRITQTVYGFIRI